MFFVLSLLNPFAFLLLLWGECLPKKAYDDKTYSGSYGDLGVTITAILLHPEVRSSNVNANTVSPFVSTYSE